MQNTETKTRPADFLSMKDAANSLPEAVDQGTVLRWIRNGLRTRDGGTVRLRCVQFGKRTYTTRAWLERFSDELVARNTTPNEDETPEPSDAALAAMRDLEARGL